VNGSIPPRPLALTLGEPAGIGPDIVIEAWLARERSGISPFIFAGDAALLARRAKLLGHTVPILAADPAEAVELFADALPCLPGAPPVEGVPGRIDPADTPQVIQSIRSAVELVRAGNASSIVTSPINKKAMSNAGFLFPGHTEFLAALALEIFGTRSTAVMMLAGPDLRVVPVTVHLPLKEVPQALGVSLIVETGRIVARELTARFGIAHPRLAVSGLNPHAGEEGILGSEDEAIVRPAVDTLRAAGIDATGPHPADTMFHAAARKTYDAALCMYHDQALIPLKTLAFDEGVNVTLGLPFVRTSPDHGTALSLAGTGGARPASLMAALRLAAKLARSDERRA
jgi:4-hydroxythreonine-4-phosphate dehydrogenase